ncbi:MAG: carboxylesterase/lipase family protein [Lachnospiraceae bacterium]|nr:carboxylesterase/lipase family protein [Lachnospiraceae bacterium]
MKKLFTIDDFMVAFISALGYGFGETIAKLSGWPGLMCAAASFALGIVLEEIISKIVFSKAVQKKTINRVITYAAILLIFLVAQYVSIRWMGVSMLEYLQEEFLYVVGLPILGLIVNILIREYRIRKIRKLYGDGSEGYVFDLNKDDIEETNEQNKPISGEYDADCAVKTRTGVFVGEKEGSILSYLGIPYAKPPVGGLRWKAPEPLPASEAVFEAKNFGASAIQVEHKGSIIRNHRQSEDCLTLNVWVDSQNTEVKKPVLVLFHYGDFTYGGSVDPLLYGDKFAEDHPDIVFVSFNYRLGIFGFIDFSEVPGGEAYPDALNLGLLDQIAALKWIKENISAFGGDPDRITVLGFDAGATSILMLTASGQAKGLFRKAFIFNGSPIFAYDTPQVSKDLAKALLKETQVDTMTELSQLETEVLKEAAQRLWLSMSAPTCDGELIPVDVYQAFRDGAASGIEFIIDIPSNQTQVFRPVIGDQRFMDGISAAVDYIQKRMDDSTAGSIQAYLEAQTAASTEFEAKSKFVEKWLTLCIHRLAVSLKEAGNQVHLMYWDEKALIENLGSGSVDVAAVLLGNGEALQMYGSVMNANLSEMLQSMLLKFINGDALKLYRNEITGVDAFDWKAFPKALIVSDGEFRCGTIEDRIAEVEGLLDNTAK